MKKKSSTVKKQRKTTGKISAAIVKSSREQNNVTCQILEYKELKEIEREIAGQLTDKFCYEFEQGGQTIRGIRAVGVRECVRFCKVRPYNFTPRFEYHNEDLGDGYFREIVTCTNPITKETTRGVCQWKRGDRFADRIAQTNAERNALLKQIPAQMQLQFINYCVKKGYIARVNVDPAIAENQEAVKQLNAGDVPEKTALITRIYAIFGKMNIDSKKAHSWLHKTYKVASMKDLTEERLQAIVKGLGDIQNNVVGKCPKVNANIITPDQLKARVEGGMNVT